MGERERTRCPREASCRAPRCSVDRCCVLVKRAGTGDGPVAREALSAFCDASWRPVYGFVRRQGYRAADAEDLTQGYFLRFLEKGYVEDVRSWRGCLRPFLWVSVRHFLANERDRARAAKRGGGRAPLSLDGAGEPGRLPPEPADAVTPEVLLERQRAAESLDRAVKALRTELQGTGRAERLACLESHLVGEDSRTGFGRIASEWGVSESAVRVALLRLRRRLAVLLREQGGSPGSAALRPARVA
jgi:DNA-directed RNA polymerase specialized sigma24 family protein